MTFKNLRILWMRTLWAQIPISFWDIFSIFTIDLNNSQILQKTSHITYGSLRKDGKKSWMRACPRDGKNGVRCLPLMKIQNYRHRLYQAAMAFSFIGMKLDSKINNSWILKYRRFMRSMNFLIIHLPQKQVIMMANPAAEELILSLLNSLLHQSRTHWQQKIWS